MKIAVRYYTKTGNTKRLAEAIAKAIGTTPGNVRKLRKRALEKLRTEYARLAMGCHEEYTGKIPYNIKRLNRCLDQPKHKKKRKKAA